MKPRIGILIALAWVASACATSSSGSDEPQRDRNRLTAEELAPLVQFTAWDAIQRLRPSWMRPGGIRNSANPAGHYPYVFVDGSPYGDMESLRGFRMDTVREMSFVDARDATIRYGGQYQGGVILITTR